MALSGLRKNGGIMIKKFKYKNKIYIALIEDGKLIHVAKDGQIWKLGEIYDFAKNKFTTLLSKSA